MMRMNLHFVLAFCFGMLSTTWAQDVSDADSIEQSLAKVRENLQAAEASEEVDEETKKKLIDSYKSAKNLYEAAIQSRDQERAFQDSIESAPLQTAEFQAQVSALGERISAEDALSEVPDEIDIQSLEQRLTSRQADLASLNGRLQSIEERIAEQKLRPETLMKQRAQIGTALSEIESALGEAAEGDALQLAVAREAALIAGKVARQAEEAMLQQEQLSLPLRASRSDAERELLVKQIANHRVRVGALQDLLILKRRELAEEQQRKAEEATRLARGKHPLVEALTGEYARATQLRSKVQRQIDEDLKQELAQIVHQLEEVRKDFERAQEQIELVGLSDSLAALLLDQWRRLPDVQSNKVAHRLRKNRIGEVGLKRLELEEKMLKLPDTRDADQVKMWLIQNYEEVMAGADQPDVLEEVKRLIDSQRTLWTSLLKDYERLLQQLGKIDFEENQHISLVEKYTQFLEERLLWIPSSGSVGKATLGDISDSILWLNRRENRHELMRFLIELPSRRPIFTGCLLILLLISIGTRTLVKQKEEAYRIGVRRISADSFGTTLRASCMLLLQSAPLPTLLGLLGMHLTEWETEHEILHALGLGLTYGSIYLFGMQVLRNACRPKGLGTAHFGWNPKIASMLRRQLLWFLPLTMATIPLVEFSEALSDEFHRNGLGRLALGVLLLSVAVMAHRVFRPEDGVLSGILKNNSGNWLERMQRIWYGALVLVPIVLAILSLLGYHHTAVQLTRRASISLLFFVGAFLIHQLIWRWFVARERRLQLEKWRQKRRAPSKTKTHEDAVQEDAVLEINEEEIDFKSLNEQTKRCLRSLMIFSLLIGVWFIWADVLPALNVLDSVKLWDREMMIDGTAIAQPVTLNHLALALILTLILSIVISNISGILEIGILQNLPMEAGSRYAIVTVVQYAIFLFGAVLVFNVLGFPWLKLGWMMAALSVGLGFGLQEVVANFVSGVILLAERPIRVGDVITVSDVTGVVTRIRIRATTITNWDRQELVVPNKEFITGKILNWTLSNKVNRVLIQIGVAYGTDTDRARRLLLEVAENHPDIMSDPKPIATFEGFDESALRLILRCYLPGLENRLSVVTQLHTDIDRAFSQAGIEISFPQRDLHLRNPADFFKTALHDFQENNANLNASHNQKQTTQKSQVASRFLKKHFDDRFEKRI